MKTYTLKKVIKVGVLQGLSGPTTLDKTSAKVLNNCIIFKIHGLNAYG
jgi:hypothetical protein